MVRNHQSDFPAAFWAVYLNVFEGAQILLIMSQFLGAGFTDVHRMGSGQKYRHPIYPARQAKPECLYRAL